MKTWISQQAAILGVLALTMLVPVFFWNQMPDPMPVHWGMNGEVDRYGSKAEGLLVFPVISLVISLLLWLMPVMDPKKKVADFAGPLRWVHLAMVVFFFAMSMILNLSVLNQEIDITLYILLAVLLLFLFLGNFFGKIRPNYFMGIRTPWTLENEEVWRLTHRLAGKLWVWGSVLMMAGVVVMHDPAYRFWIFLGGTLVISLWPVGYSYFLYRKISKS